jgi:hypothetical protein
MLTNHLTVGLIAFCSLISVSHAQSTAPQAAEESIPKAHIVPYKKLASVPVRKHPGLTNEEVIRRVLDAAHSYAEGISCVDGPSTPNDIVTLKPYEKDDPLDSEFLVFWVGDVGCNGGSATTTQNIALVRVGSFNQFYVDPLRSSPAVGLPVGQIAKIIGNTTDSITLETLEYAESDAHCCPSVRYQVTLQVDKNGQWNEIKRKAMTSK